MDFKDKLSSHKDSEMSDIGLLNLCMIMVQNWLALLKWMVLSIIPTELTLKNFKLIYYKIKEALRDFPHSVNILKMKRQFIKNVMCLSQPLFSKPLI